MTDARQQHLIRFYSILDVLESEIGGKRKLADCHGRMEWPRRGVYFFREAGEARSDTGTGPRVVRVGTHALKEGGDATLWSRLCTHKGQSKNGGGNHRGSIFRDIVGTSLMRRDSHTSPTWGRGNSASKDVRVSELVLERAVSQVIRNMPFVWLTVVDEPGPGSMRGRIERNAIALLSNFNKSPLGQPSSQWLGHFCDRDRVRASGLWNQNHVDEEYDPGFLDQMEHCLREMAGR